MKAFRFYKYIKLINLYPPFLGAGIKLKDVSKDKRTFVVQMKMRFYNKNIYGTHFGGSLYSMCDPWYVFIAYGFFRDEYVLWDKSASIDFLKPGKGTMEAVFHISDKKLEEMKHKVDRDGKSTFVFSTYVKDENGKQVASVTKEIYIRKRLPN